MTPERRPVLVIDRRGALRAGMLCMAAVAGAPILAVIEGCVAGAPRAIAYGRDECINCRMIVGDPRHSAQVVTAKGRTLVFDSVECVAAFVQRNGASASGERSTIGSVWVSGFLAPNALLPAEQAWYARLSGSASPMGKGLAAFATQREARASAGAGAMPMRWNDVLALMLREGMGRSDHDAPRG